MILVRETTRKRSVVVWLVIAVLLATTVIGDKDEDVAGPVVKMEEVQVSGKVAASSPPAKSNNTEPADNKAEGIVNIVAGAAKEVAREVDKKLIKEFGNGSSSETTEQGKSFTAALNSSTASASGAIKESETAKLETVVRISNTGAGTAGSGNGTTEGQPAEENASAADVLEASVEKSVDRIIDQHDNEFVLSKPNSEVASLMLDPQLITDLTVVITAAAVFGMIFEALRQPTINGYLIAGALVGPGGLQLVKELVQVETIAQLGVSLLLFGLGMELNLSKIKSVLGVTIIGGSAQILIAMILGGAIAAWVCDAPVMQGVFTGALLSMSSTSVVVKCLEVTRSMNTSYGSITVGTLILQDCTVGLLFALMPVFKPTPPRMTEASPEDAAEVNALILVMILRVLFKLVVVGGASLLLARTVLSHLLRILRRHGSRELCQLVLVGFCFSGAWLCGKAGLSEELGAFLAGVMVAAAVNAGPATTAAAKAEELHATRHSVDSVHNVLTALFMASTALIISPRFLMQHVQTLAVGTLCLMVLKAALVAGTVAWFGYTWRVSLAVGVTMAHVGEFGFVLLSMSTHLKILPAQMYQLLLGITALSLLTTPLVIIMCSRLLREKQEGVMAGAGGSGKAGSTPAPSSANHGDNRGSHGVTPSTGAGAAPAATGGEMESGVVLIDMGATSGKEEDELRQRLLGAKALQDDSGKA
mmetsp:Transcript_16165/g.35012  ORF Transcript_16165/g.35012 Transcript_16165/m.35012 type:complete len:704 (+) Transcript_16165:101-2212(+)